MSEESLIKLTALAKDASKSSYSPYSKFPVGCALLTTDGKIFTGCNVENISFGLTMCAERSAVYNAISNCGPNIKLAHVVIYTPTEVAITPCGACRQVLREFGEDFEVISVCRSETTIKSNINLLLPDSPNIKF
jgi:cytidine deaminase